MSLKPACLEREGGREVEKEKSHEQVRAGEREDRERRGNKERDEGEREENSWSGGSLLSPGSLIYALKPCLKKRRRKRPLSGKKSTGCWAVYPHDP